MSKRVPKYRKHPNGQAFVQHKSIEGASHRLYLGVFGSAESKRKYQQFLAQLNAQDEALPQIDLGEIHGRTVAEICAMYLLHAERYYVGADGRKTSEFGVAKSAVDQLLALYGDEQANQFGPRKLIALQRRLIKLKFARTTANKYVGLARRVFQWACSEELIRPEIYHGLVSVKGLREGRSEAREPDDIQPVAWETVELVLPYMSPVVRAMVKVQYLCGMRPQEVCLMRRCDIDMSDEIWIYSPSHHKNAWRKQVLVKAIPVAAQETLAGFFRGKRAAYLFNPHDSWRWHLDQRRSGESDRKTPVYPSEVRRLEAQRASTRMKVPTTRDHFSTGGYRQSIHYAIDKAQEADVETEKWSPNQLRHSIATSVSQDVDDRAAQRWLGHKRIETTGTYIQRQVAELIAIARQLDSQWAAG